jgi:hypothetical protein
MENNVLVPIDENEEEYFRFCDTQCITQLVDSVAVFVLATLTVKLLQILMV